MQREWFGVLWCVLLGLVFWGLRSTAPETPTSAAAQDEQPAAAKPGDAAPVEKDMHEFMEYVFEPTFKRLKTALAAEPADKAGWKTIKSDSLILAEGGNLLLGRVPEEDADAWIASSTAVRQAGAELYQGAKARDYTASRKAYVTMIEHCNQCHTDAAAGEHQLEP